MFVQRLTSWLRRMFASLSSPTRSAQPLRSDDSAVMSGCATGQRARGQDAAAGASGSWLADGRTLRPRPTTQNVQESRRPARGVSPRPQPAADLSGPPRRAAPSRPVPAHPAADAVPPEITPARAQPPQPAPPSRPIQPVRLTPASLEPQQEEADISDQALYRRLMSLKRLVRLGIYGEGFDAPNVPEQYLHSLGRDDSFDVGWDQPPEA